MIKLFFLSLGMIFTTPEAGVEKIDINVASSSVKWTGAKVGGSHNGAITLKSGSLAIEEGRLVGGSFVIDMTSISNEDLQGEYAGKLVGHLKSDDFFGVETYPTASFEITNVVPQGTGKYKVEGDLTIKGITKSIKFPASVEEKDGAYVATADITVDRSEYNVKYGSGSFFDDLGDKVIYDDFNLSVSLTTSK